MASSCRGQIAKWKGWGLGVVGHSHNVSLEARMTVGGDWKEGGGSLDH